MGLPPQQPVSDQIVNWDDMSKVSYESKHPQIFEILLRKPRHRRMRRELGNDEKMTDHHVTYDFIQKVWYRALISARDPDQGAEQGREEEYYWHRADMSLWTSYFGPEENALEFQWDYHPPSPKLPPETQEEMINRAREEILKRQEPGQSEENKWIEGFKLHEESEKEWKKVRARQEREENEAKKREEEIKHATQESPDNRKTLIRKDPQRPFYRAVPDIGDLVGVGVTLPDARVLNAFEYLSSKQAYQGYTHTWTGTNTEEFGLIYLPPNWEFTHKHPRPWSAFIGPAGKYASELNQNFRNIVKICGQQLDQNSRIRIPREDQCEIHGLWVQPVRKEDMNDPRVMEACKELAEQFIRSWVTYAYEDASSRDLSIARYWHSWVQILGRKPLIQLLEDLEISTRKSSHPLHGKRPRSSAQLSDYSLHGETRRNYNESGEESPAHKVRI